MTAPTSGGDSSTFDVFVSYRRKDARKVLLLADALSVSSLRVWVDQREIGDFESITDAIRKGIAQSKTFVAWYSADYPKSRPCQQELTAAFIAAQRLGDPRERVFVINPESTASHVVPIQLADQQHPPVADLAALANRLVDTIGNLRDPLGSVSSSLPPQHGYKLAGSRRFVGRLEELWAIHSGLFAKESSILSGDERPGIVQLTGLGGIGKSLLAEEYALRFASAFPTGIFWLRGSAFDAGPQYGRGDAIEARRREQARSIAIALGIDVEGIGYDKVEAELGKALRNSRNEFLWVIDDLASDLPAEVFRRWLAPAPNGRTLITTRSQTYGAIGTIVPVPVLPSEEAFALLTARREPSGEDARAAERLCQDLGFHPLALDVAGSALVAWSGTIEEFRRGLAEPARDELDLAAELADALPNGHEKSIAATLLRSIRGLGHEGQDFLRIAAGIAAFPIPVPFIEHTFREVEDIGGNARQWTSLALAQCAKASLSEGAADAPRRVHVLVARTMRLHDSDPDRQATIQEAAVRALNSVLPIVADVRAHHRLAMEVAHARALVRDPRGSPSRAELLGWVARYDVERGEYTLAEVSSRTQLSIYETFLGKRNARTLLAAGDLARALRGQSKNVEAAEIEKHVLKQRTKLLGRDHIDTLTAMNNLAATLDALGDYEGACRLQRRVLQARQRLFGPEHEHTLFAMNNLAATLSFLGRTAEALPMMLQAYESRKKVLGDDHVNTLISRTSLAVCLWELGDSNAAERHLRETISALERVQGPLHPRTLSTKVTLGRILISQGRAETAIELLAPVVDALRAKLGDTQQETLLAMNNYGKALALCGRYAEARPLLEAAVRGQRPKKKAPDWLFARFALNLAETYVELGDQILARNVLSQDLAWLLQTTRRPVDSQEALDYDRMKKLAAVVGLSKRGRRGTEK
jgi:tetratricopeptide (TPR) repeat protein